MFERSAYKENMLTAPRRHILYKQDKILYAKYKKMRYNNGKGRITMQENFRMGRTTLEKEISISAVDTVFYFEFNDGFRDHVESHPAWEMIYADRGRCEILADEHTFMLEQGELYFHKPHESHMLRIPKGEFPNILICSFHCDSPALTHLRERKLRASLTVKGHISSIIHEAVQTFDQSDRRLLIQGVLFRSENRLFGGEQSILLRLELMLLELLREHAFRPVRENRFLPKEQTDPLSRRIIEFLEENLYRPLDMDALCRRVGFSRSYISKHFSRTCATPLVRYFNKMKMEEAKRLIRETKYSFFEISEMLMLSNSHYFSTLFKAYVGMTPTEYKQSCK